MKTAMIFESIKRIVRGKEKLSISFWGYGCIPILIFLCMLPIGLLVESNPDIETRLISPPTVKHILDVWGFSGILWGSLVLWNVKNTDKNFLGYLARVLAIACALFAIFFFAICVAARWSA